jgi:hypothetical protein
MKFWGIINLVLAITVLILFLFLYDTFKFERNILLSVSSGSIALFFIVKLSKKKPDSKS